jgi:hypothetical protein
VIVYLLDVGPQGDAKQVTNILDVFDLSFNKEMCVGKIVE